MHDRALSEVAATAKKAVRGAGYSWGVAEEAAMATHWLCAAGLDGCGALARALSGEGLDSCPVLNGIALADQAAGLILADLNFTDVREPMLLLPFVGHAATRLGRTITMIFDGHEAVTDGGFVTVKQPTFPTFARNVAIQVGGYVTNPLPVCRRVTPSQADWDVLNGFAERTYAPATEQSRQSGAGAGLNDND